MTVLTRTSWCLPAVNGVEQVQGMTSREIQSFRCVTVLLLKKMVQTW